MQIEFAVAMTGVFGFWFLGSVAFTFFTGMQIRKKYTEPLEEIADAARKVAEGDFSVIYDRDIRRIKPTVWMCWCRILIRWWRNWEARKH